MKTSDKVLTFTAIFISCLALAVSIIQTRIIQQQSQAAVWPRLTNGQGHGADYFIYTVHNEGVGPAIINDVEYSYKDTSFQKINDLVHYFGRLEKEESGKSIYLNFNYSNLYKGGVIAASKEIDIFIANDSTAVILGMKYLSKTNIKVDYCSIYETCWSMQNDNIIELD